MLVANQIYLQRTLKSPYKIVLSFLLVWFVTNLSCIGLSSNMGINLKQLPEKGFAYIYYLTPSNNQNDIRYIGKTSFSLEQRLRGHLEDLKYSYKFYKANWIKSLFQQNLKPEIHLLDVIPEFEWQFWEIHYISLFRSWGFDLTNLTPGGEGVYKGFKHSEESEKRRKQKQKEYWDKLSQEERDNWKQSIRFGQKNSNYKHSEDIERNKKIRIGVSQTYQNKSQEEKILINERKSQTYQSKTEEEKLEINKKKSKSHKGIIQSEQWKQNRSKAMQGKNKSEEFAKKLRKPHSKLKYSKEQVIEVINLLQTTKLTHSEVSKKTQVSGSVVGEISCNSSPCNKLYNLYVNKI